MRTPLARSAAEGFGPRTATAILDRSSVNLVVAPRESVAANSARVPTPVWKMASFAGRSSSERTSAAMASGSRSGSSASAGAWNATPPRPSTSPPSWRPPRPSTVPPPGARVSPPSALLYSAGKPRVRERKALDGIAHQRPREVKLRAVAQALQGLGLELGHDHVGGRLAGGLARLLAAADERHLAEALAFVDHT